MEISLRKATSHLNVTYKSENFTNNLIGRNFTVEKTNGFNIIGIDFSGNYRVQNKLTNSYSDVFEFIEEHEDLKFVQVDEPKVLEGLVKAHNSNPEAAWKLKIHVGEHGTFEFNVLPEIQGTTLFLNVT